MPGRRAAVIGCTGSVILAERDADPGEFPYIVSIQFTDVVDLPLCIGTIINDITILTAAYCTGTDFRRILRYLVVVAGSHILLPNETTHIVTRRVIHYDTYPRYNPKYGKHDLAILSIGEPLKFDPEFSVGRIAVAKTISPDGTTCTILGWGIIEKFKIHAENIPLIVTTVRIYHKEECSFIFRTAITEAQICTDRPTLFRKGCSLDIGSPLICDNRLVGIGSKYLDCINPMVPNIFTWLGGYRKYIKSEDFGTYSVASKIYYWNFEIVLINFVYIFLVIH